MISIVSLIYRSTQYADAVHDSIMEFTPMIQAGEAEFFFIANDPTPELVKHLGEKGYKFFVNNNERRTNQQLFAQGIGWPEYIHRVYKGWNEAIKKSTGERVVLVNSDNMFAPNWLENLLKHSTKQNVVCSQLVERTHPKYSVFPGAYRGEFGTHPNHYNKQGFLDFCKKRSLPITKIGGAYMPCMFFREVAIQVGLYPEGNVCGKSFRDIVRYGDQDLFYRFDKSGVKHITVMDSLSYHFKEGEMDE